MISEEQYNHRMEEELSEKMNEEECVICKVNKPNWNGFICKNCRDKEEGAIKVIEEIGGIEE